MVVVLHFLQLAQTVGPYNGGAGAAGTPNTYVPSSTATTQEAGMAQVSIYLMHKTVQLLACLLACLPLGAW